MALLTKAQREWIDLKKLFDRQKPSKRPLIHPTSPIRKWCYDRAVHKRGWWMRTMTLFFFLHILVLMYVSLFCILSTLLTNHMKRTQTFPASTLTDSLRSKFRSFGRPVNDIDSFQTTSSWFLCSFTFLMSPCAFLVWDGAASDQTAGIYSISLSPLAVSLQLLPFALVTVD